MGIGDRLGLNVRTRIGRDYVESHRKMRQKTINTIKKDQDLEPDSKTVLQEASDHIKESKELLDKNNLLQSYMYSLMAERRIMVLLFNNSDNFGSILDVRKADYRSEARRHQKKMGKDDKENIGKVLKKDNPSKKDWLDLVAIITGYRVSSVGKRLTRDLKIDTITRHLAYFTCITIIIISLLFILTFADILSIFEESVLVGETQSMTLLSSMIFGAFGALVFGILSSREVVSKKDVGSQVKELNIWMFISGIILGAIAAPIVIILIYSGLFRLGQILTPTGILAISFVAGYSDTLLRKAVESNFSNPPQNN